MNIPRSLLAFALMHVCGAAAASEWMPVAVSTNKTHFVDISSIRVTGNIRRMWIKTVFQTKTEKGSGEDANKWLKHVLYHQAFDCDNESARDEAEIDYYDDGTSYLYPATDFPLLWTPIAPDSVGSIFLRTICEWKPGN